MFYLNSQATYFHKFIQIFSSFIFYFRQLNIFKFKFYIYSFSHFQYMFPFSFKSFVAYNYSFYLTKFSDNLIPVTLTFIMYKKILSHFFQNTNCKLYIHIQSFSCSYRDNFIISLLYSK